jgi:branched-chain amino acid transport system substrate-binding protein
MQSITVDTEGLTGGPIKMSPDDHYGPTYWKLYRWDGKQLSGVGDWLKKDAVKFGEKRAGG